MTTSPRWYVIAAAVILAPVRAPAQVIFSTGGPDGKIATASRPGPASGPNQEAESADDFILTAAKTFLTGGSFFGLTPANATVSQIRIEIYRVFPKDSTSPPSGNVPTRTNSPSDVEFADRDSAVPNLTFTTTLLGVFTASNSVDLGIHAIPFQFTGGEGPVTGTEVLFDVNFASPITLPPDHYFFVPQVLLSNPDNHFLWLSAPRPITAPGTPFAPDLQSWIRNATLDPDWLRVGTDITHQGTFNGAFLLRGSSVPEPSSAVLLLSAVAAVFWACTMRRRRATA